MTELLPCPFCGNTPKLINPGYHGDEYATAPKFDIACGTKGCLLENGADWFCEQAEIAAMWNQRAINQRIAELELWIQAACNRDHSLMPLPGIEIDHRVTPRRAKVDNA